MKLTYNIYSFVSRDTDLGALGTEINTDDTHGQEVCLHENKLIGRPGICTGGLRGQLGVRKGGRMWEKVGDKSGGHRMGSC
jgi:hypothetical protein